MTHERWTSGDSELTNALRVLYAAPAEDGYWDALEARILQHIAYGSDRSVWWDELVDMIRPGLVAAAALILAASIAMVHSQRREAESAYATLITPTPTTVETSARATSVGDGDMAIHLLLSH